MDIQILIGTIVRHLAQLASGALVASGYLTEAGGDEFVTIIGGAVVFVIATVWSYRTRKTLKESPAA